MLGVRKPVAFRTSGKINDTTVYVIGHPCGCRGEHNARDGVERESTEGESWPCDASDQECEQEIVVRHIERCDIRCG
jgi:hypothetical protein